MPVEDSITGTQFAHQLKNQERIPVRRCRSRPSLARDVGPNSAPEIHRRKAVRFRDGEPSLNFICVRKRESDFAMVGPTQSVMAT